MGGGGVIDNYKVSFLRCYSYIQITHLNIHSQSHLTNDIRIHKCDLENAQKCELGSISIPNKLSVKCQKNAHITISLEKKTENTLELSKYYLE